MQLIKINFTSVVTIEEVTQTMIYTKNRIVFHYKKSGG